MTHLDLYSVIINVQIDNVTKQNKVALHNLSKVVTPLLV